MLQELSYRKQIARQLRTQFVETIHDLLLDELLDIEYYRDFEIGVRGHSKSLKVWVRFPNFSYPNSNPNLRVRGQGH